MGKNIGKNIDKYSQGMLVARQNLLDHTKKSTTDALKAASKNSIQKSAEATGELIDNKIADKFTKNSLQNNSDTDSEPKENQ